MAAANLPHELLTTILIRLPIPSLLRCRRVCRSWRYLIATPLFISAHHNHNHHSSHPTLLLRRRCHRIDLSTANLKYTLHYDDESLTHIAHFHFPFPRPNAFPRILGSVNGLICLSGESDTLILWNPTIQKSLILPAPNPRLTPGNNHLQFGFGFDYSSHDYKILRIDFGATPPLLDIYRLTDRSWSRVLIPATFVLPILFPRQAFLNGVVHWLASDSTIVGFDMATERFIVLELPAELKSKGMEDVGIASWRGFLAVFERGIVGISLWVMKVYGVAESWTKECAISGHPIRVKSIASNGKILIEGDAPLRLFWFDPATRKVALAPALKISFLGDVDFLHMKPFTESLALVDVVGDVAVDYSTEGDGDGPTRSCRWSQEEEEILVRAWLRFPTGGNRWSQMEGYFRKFSKVGTRRGLSQLKQRWFMVNKAVLKFQSCYEKVRRLHRGGLDEHGRVLEAYRVYKDEESVHFRHGHVWRLLKDEPRWSNDGWEGRDAEGPSKRVKVAESTDVLGSQMEQVRSGTRALELNALMKEKELAMKQREMDLQIVYKDIAGMTEEQVVVHRRLLDGARKRIEADP